MAPSIMPRGTGLDIESLDIETKENSGQIPHLVIDVELIGLEIQYTHGIDHWKRRIESHFGTEVELLLLYAQEVFRLQQDILRTQWMTEEAKQESDK